MAATLTGISTIRASKASERLALEFDNLQNVHSSVWQILMSVNTGVCCKAINDEHGRWGKDKETLNFYLFLYFVLDCSFGTLVGLCIVRLCGLRLFQLHHDESGKHDEFECRFGDLSSTDFNRNGSIWNQTNDGVVPTVHEH